MMNFTDIFIRRPVLATRRQPDDPGARPARRLGACRSCNIRARENAVVTVTTTYYGADPDVVAGFITTPLENAIAQAERHRLHDLDQPERRQHDHRLSAARITTPTRR